MNSNHEHRATQDYDDDLVALLEAVWGDGFMSPGGTGEVDRVVDGLALKDMTVLDIGCGVGGADVHFASTYEPATVIGIDVEANLIDHCRRLSERRGTSHITDFRQVDPGPLPLPDSSIDLAFSKDSIIHIPDKGALAAEIYRCLKPGGYFAASDWLAGYDDQPSAEMQAYIEAEGLDFGLASAAVYQHALSDAGFENIQVNERNAWYRQEARRERENLEGALFSHLETALGREFVTREIDVWDKMIIALDQGQLMPTHLRARKPGPPMRPPEVQPSDS
jgi:phosphoethanolamine N-methyltransferase